LVQAIFVQALQGIVSRNVPALESVVVSVGHIVGGTKEALNVLPAELVVGGTMRAFNSPMQALIERRIRELADLAAATQGATAEVSLWWNAIPLVNHERETDVC
jgi:hippurate hydrolase